PKAALDDALAVLRAIDRPARAVHVEVLLVASGGDAKAPDPAVLSGAARDVKARLRELRQKGVVSTVKAVELTTLEGQLARARLTERKPFVTSVALGRGFGGGGPGGRGGGGGGPGGGPMTRSITYREVGTSVQVKPEVGADGVVSLELRVEDSQMRAAEGV